MYLPSSEILNLIEEYVDLFGREVDLAYSPVIPEQCFQAKSVVNRMVNREIANSFRAYTSIDESLNRVVVFFEVPVMRVIALIETPSTYSLMRFGRFVLRSKRTFGTISKMFLVMATFIHGQRFCADTKLVPSWYVGRRDTASAMGVCQ